jgi:hypothetical protein
MTLFFLLLLDPPSFLHPRGPGCAVPGDHAPSASRATAIPDRGPLFVSDDPAEGAGCGESAAVVGARRLGPVPARRKGEDPRRGGDVAWRPGRGVGSPVPGADQGRVAPGAGVPEDAGRAGLGWLARGVPSGRGGCARCGRSFSGPRTRRSAASRRGVCKTHKLFLQRTVIGLGLIGTDAEG